MIKRERNNGTAEPYILCPLYFAMGRKEIMCVSVNCEAKADAMMFDTVEEKEKQLRLYCNENWKKCEHYLAWRHFQWEEDE